MQIGFNFTLGSTLPLFRQLISERRIDFVEILIDNFLQVDPKELAAAFDCPVALHIMFSKFLEKDLDFLEDLARRLRTYIDALKPVYVSDHLVRFSHNGRNLFHLVELDYASEYYAVRERVEWWQDKLGQRLYLENYPSIMDGGREAPGFLERLTSETGAGVLFDVSNAVVANLNCGLPLESWRNIISATEHFHVAGYNTSFIEPHIIVDLHDSEFSRETITFLESCRQHCEKPGATITYERDTNIEHESISVDLDNLRRIFRSGDMAETMSSELNSNTTLSVAPRELPDSRFQEPKGERDVSTVFTSVRTDRELADALTAPASQQNYADDPRAFVRIDHSLRLYWHTLFDICPELLRLSGPDGLSIFRPFMAWAAEQHLTFDWSYYLWVYAWLRQSEFRDLLDDELRTSLMAASAARWATFDRSMPGVIALGCVEMQGLVCGCKPRTYDAGRTVEYLDLEESLPLPDGLFGFFTLLGHEIDRFPGWSPIPR
jgi:uncharacterized protein